MCQPLRERALRERVLRAKLAAYGEEHARVAGALLSRCQERCWGGARARWRCAPSPPTSRPTATGTLTPSTPTPAAAASARSGQPAAKDPRASGKKQQSQVQQSNQRIDGYIRQLKPSMSEMAAQVLELYYQFSPDSVLEYATYDESTDQWIRDEIKRVKLRNRNMTIEVARTSVQDNPDAILQRAMTDYEIWSKEPLVGMNVQRRWELVRQTMFAERKTNISKLLPPLKQLMQEMQQQDQQLGGPEASPSQQALLEAAHEKAGKPKKEGGTGKRQGSSDHRPSQLDRGQK
jgi:hypothetical protein